MREEAQRGDKKNKLKRSARRFKDANVGDSVMVHLPEVDRGRCEFPNVHAVVLSVNESQAGYSARGTEGCVFPKSI